MRYISQTQGDTDSMATTVPNLDCWRWIFSENLRWEPTLHFPGGWWGKGQLLIGGGHCNRITPSEMKKIRSTEGEINRPRIFFRNGKWKTPKWVFLTFKKTHLWEIASFEANKFYSSAERQRVEMLPLEWMEDAHASWVPRTFSKSQCRVIF